MNLNVPLSDVMLCFLSPIFFFTLLVYMREEGLAVVVVVNRNVGHMTRKDVCFVPLTQFYSLCSPCFRQLHKVTSKNKVSENRDVERGARTYYVRGQHLESG
jgi:hypothetical protein